jgi:hypothetical protein
MPRFFFPGYGAYKWFTGPHRTVDDSVSEVDPAMHAAINKDAAVV